MRKDLMDRLINGEMKYLKNLEALIQVKKKKKKKKFCKKKKISQKKFKKNFTKKKKKDFVEPMKLKVTEKKSKVSFVDYKSIFINLEKIFLLHKILFEDLKYFYSLDPIKGGKIFFFII